jgi:hypothetical protein
MDDETVLRRLVRDAVGEQRLPPRRPDRMWGGPGNGQRCAICTGVLDREEMGFELEFAGAGPAGAAINHHAHVRCFAAWEFERDRSGAVDPSSLASFTDAQASPPAVNGKNGTSLHASVADGTIGDCESTHFHPDGGTP